MSGELTKLSETRWRFATGRRLFYVRQLKAPNEDTGEFGRYLIDAGADDRYLVEAEGIESLVMDLRHDTCAAARGPQRGRESHG